MMALTNFSNEVYHVWHNYLFVSMSFWWQIYCLYLCFCGYRTKCTLHTHWWRETLNWNAGFCLFSIVSAMASKLIMLVIWSAHIRQNPFSIRFQHLVNTKWKIFKTITYLHFFNILFIEHNAKNICKTVTSSKVQNLNKQMAEFGIPILFQYFIDILA